MSEWQPIETCPKDQWVILYLPWVKWVRQGRYNLNHIGRKGWKVCYRTKEPSTLGASLEPSHWMPLPEPPLSEEDQQRIERMREREEMRAVRP